MGQRFIWGHININVTDLDTSIAFYELLGFEVFMPSIPYLGLEAHTLKALSEVNAKALGIPLGVEGRSCIMQLGKGLPKLDLTEWADIDRCAPLSNQDLGLVRICLATQHLQSDYQQLLDQGVEFLTPPCACTERMADIAVCKDPDGTLIELLQVDLSRWPRVQA